MIYLANHSINPYWKSLNANPLPINTCLIITSLKAPKEKPLFVENQEINREIRYKSKIDAPISLILSSLVFILRLKEVKW